MNTAMDGSGDLATEPILSAAAALAPQIRDLRQEIEEGRRLPDSLVEAMKQAGVFRMAMPQEWGGPELDLPAQLRVLEKLAEVDASAGWCAMIGCDGGYATAFLDQNVARDMYPDLDAPTAWAASLTGRAVKVPGGYRLSGRWPFSSGCQHASWLIGGCLVYEGDKQRLGEDGSPETRQCFVSQKDATILDTWYTTGLRGSGSHDWTLEEYFVPEEQTFSFQDLQIHRNGPLYSFPLNFILKAPGVYLGVARAAIDALIEAGERPTRRMTIGASVSPAAQLRDESFLQDAVGRAEALVGAARSYTYDTAARLHETMTAGKEISPSLFVHTGLLNPQVAEMCTQAVSLCYKARGGSAVYQGGPLDRCFRDMSTMNQHLVNSLRAFGTAGRTMLGFPPEAPLI